MKSFLTAALVALSLIGATTVASADPISFDYPQWAQEALTSNN